MKMVGRRLIFRGEFAWSALHGNLTSVKLKSRHVHTRANSEQFTVSSLLRRKAIRTPGRAALQHEHRNAAAPSSDSSLLVLPHKRGVEAQNIIPFHFICSQRKHKIK